MEHSCCVFAACMAVHWMDMEYALNKHEEYALWAWEVHGCAWVRYKLTVLSLQRLKLLYICGLREWKLGYYVVCLACALAEQGDQKLSGIHGLGMFPRLFCPSYLHHYYSSLVVSLLHRSTESFLPFHPGILPPAPAPKYSCSYSWTSWTSCSWTSSLRFYFSCFAWRISPPAACVVPFLSFNWSDVVDSFREIWNKDSLLNIKH